MAKKLGSEQAKSMTPEQKQEALRCIYKMNLAQSNLQREQKKSDEQLKALLALHPPGITTDQKGEVEAIQAQLLALQEEYATRLKSLAKVSEPTFAQDIMRIEQNTDAIAALTQHIASILNAPPPGKQPITRVSLATTSDSVWVTTEAEGSKSGMKGPPEVVSQMNQLSESIKQFLMERDFNVRRLSCFHLPPLDSTHGAIAHGTILFDRSPVRRRKRQNKKHARHDSSCAVSRKSLLYTVAMKVALVHELLTMKGGAERVLKVFADMFPDAPIYTLLYNEEKLSEWFPAERIRTSELQKSIFHFPLSLLRQQYNHHLHLRSFPKAVESWDFFDYDLVISSSSAFAHGIITNGKPKHLCYVQSPARYLWDRTHDVLNRAGKGVLGTIRRRYLERTFHKLRTWDAEAADRPDKLIAASREIERRIELYWRRESDVIYPPIDDFWFIPGAESRGSQLQGYFLIVSTLVHYKRIELAIDACNKGGKTLKIVGEGPARRDLEKRAGPTVEFLGFQPQEKVQELYINAQATLFPGDEDFGLVPLESMACGTPVIAYRSGGALETIEEGKTGEFFSAPNADDLLSVMEKCETKTYDIQTCRMRAQKFSRERFEQEINGAIDELMHASPSHHLQQ